MGSAPTRGERARASPSAVAVMSNAKRSPQDASGKVVPGSKELCKRMKAAQDVVAKTKLLALLKISPVETQQRFANARPGLAILQQWLLEAKKDNPRSPILEETLRVLLQLPVTIESLRKHTVGKSVKRLAKEFAGNEVGRVAAHIMDKWLTIINEVAPKSRDPSPTNASSSTPGPKSVSSRLSPSTNTMTPAGTGRRPTKINDNSTTCKRKAEELPPPPTNDTPAIKATSKVQVKPKQAHYGQQLKKLKRTYQEEGLPFIPCLQERVKAPKTEDPRTNELISTQNLMYQMSDIAEEFLSTKTAESADTAVLSYGTETSRSSQSLPCSPFLDKAVTDRKILMLPSGERGRQRARKRVSFPPDSHLCQVKYFDTADPVSEERHDNASNASVEYFLTCSPSIPSSPSFSMKRCSGIATESKELKSRFPIQSSSDSPAEKDEPCQALGVNMEKLTLQDEHGRDRGILSLDMEMQWQATNDKKHVATSDSIRATTRWHIPCLLSFKKDPRPLQTRGTEAKIQEIRERTVAPVVYICESDIPDSPHEPDDDEKQEQRKRETKEIPAVDTENVAHQLLWTEHLTIVSMGL
ncbi:hypothetical protein HK102_011771 [Quaeritorhiza haematococci]|nr:hypothetical protein HK102_011771 [Quaeritorhiza haematococci]